MGNQENLGIKEIRRCASRYDILSVTARNGDMRPIRRPLSSDSSLCRPGPKELRLYSMCQRCVYIKSP